MAKIQIPHYLLPKLGSGANSGFCLVTVELLDGRIFSNLVVKEGIYITGRRADVGGEGPLPFSSGEICDIQRCAFIF
ncbi:hypothetical protein GTP44_15365 [Duganella sp. FT50W]|uniref:Uncharacterized protein n=1 Tax=Duganella lactea TaxID=2692173 RepID=A0A6L8MM54_9BURK|nr:hypothetical protein [Duganella lactea]MYM83331.1 hypothetical protein [Duganella lactea]